MSTVLEFGETISTLDTDVLYLIRPDDATSKDKQITMANFTSSIPKGIEWINPYTPGEYAKDIMVREQNWTMISNKITSDLPNPQPEGDPSYLYSGIDQTSKTATAKQIITGIRVSKVDPYWIEGYKVNVVEGNHYSVVLAKDPLGLREIQTLHEFVATDSVAKVFNLQPIPASAGVIFDLLVITTQPDPTPIVTLANYDYTKPKDTVVPSTGVIMHADKDLEHLWINYIDHDLVDQTTLIQSLVAGSLINLGDKEWAVQDIDIQGTYAVVGVSPASQSTSDGVLEFTFETPPDAILSYLSEDDYWLTNPDAKGLFVVDGGINDTVQNENAYGVDIFVQNATVSPDWDMVAYTGITGGAGANSGAVASTDLSVNFVRSLNQEVTLAFHGEGDDKGVALTGGQFSVGDRYNGKESCFGEGDSYPVPQAYHCTSADTTGLTIVNAVDVTQTLKTDEGSATGLFGGITAGDYLLVKSDIPYAGIKNKYTVLEDVEPTSIVAEYLFDDTPTWTVAPFMATNADKPYDSTAHHIAQNTKEHIRFGFNPLDRQDLIWEEATLNINGLDETGYWGRFRILTDIVADPQVEQIKLHTSRTEINKEGTFEFFGEARYRKTVQSGLGAIIPNSLADPADQSVQYGANFSAKFKDNRFADGARDGFGLVQSIEAGTDTSIPMILTVSYYVDGTATGDIDFSVEVFQVADGFVYDGNNIPSTYTDIETVITPSDQIRRTATLLIDQNDLVPGETAVLVSIYRDASGGNPNDTLGEDVVITNTSLVSYFWK